MASSIPTAAHRAQVDQEMARIDATINMVLAPLRESKTDVDSDPQLAMVALIDQMRSLPLFNTKALAARLLVRLSQAEVR